MGEIKALVWYWVATLWVIWINRNKVIFRGECWNLDDMEKHIKHLVWCWVAFKVDPNINVSFESWSLGIFEDSYVVPG